MHLADASIHTVSLRSALGTGNTIQTILEAVVLNAPSACEILLPEQAELWSVFANGQPLRTYSGEAGRRLDLAGIGERSSVTLRIVYSDSATVLRSPRILVPAAGSWHDLPVEDGTWTVSLPPTHALLRTTGNLRLVRSPEHHELVERALAIAGKALRSPMLLPALSKARESARRINCAGNLKQIGLALLMYAGEQDSFPPDFQALVEDEYLVDGKVYCCPSATKIVPTATGSSYRYLAGNLDADVANKSTTVLAYCAEHPGVGWMNVLFADGHVEGFLSFGNPAALHRQAAQNGWILPTPGQRLRDQERAGQRSLPIELGLDGPTFAFTFANAWPTAQLRTIDLATTVPLGLFVSLLAVWAIRRWPKRRSTLWLALLCALACLWLWTLPDRALRTAALLPAGIVILQITRCHWRRQAQIAVVSLCATTTWATDPILVPYDPELGPATATHALVPLQAPSPAPEPQGIGVARYEIRLGTDNQVRCSGRVPVWARAGETIQIHCAGLSDLQVSSASSGVHLHSDGLVQHLRVEQPGRHELQIQGLVLGQKTGTGRLLEARLPTSGVASVAVVAETNLFADGRSRAAGERWVRSLESDGRLRLFSRRTNPTQRSPEIGQMRATGTADLDGLSAHWKITLPHGGEHTLRLPAPTVCVSISGESVRSWQRTDNTVRVVLAPGPAELQVETWAPAQTETVQLGAPSFDEVSMRGTAILRPAPGCLLNGSAAETSLTVDESPWLGTVRSVPLSFQVEEHSTIHIRSQQPAQYQATFRCQLDQKHPQHLQLRIPQNLRILDLAMIPPGRWANGPDQTVNLWFSQAATKHTEVRLRGEIVGDDAACIVTSPTFVGARTHSGQLAIFAPEQHVSRRSEDGARQINPDHLWQPLPSPPTLALAFGPRPAAVPLSISPRPAGARIATLTNCAITDSWYEDTVLLEVTPHGPIDRVIVNLPARFSQARIVAGIPVCRATTVSGATATLTLRLSRKTNSQFSIRLTVLRPISDAPFPIPIPQLLEGQVTSQFVGIENQSSAEVRVSEFAGCLPVGYEDEGLLGLLKSPNTTRFRVTGKPGSARILAQIKRRQQVAAKQQPIGLCQARARTAAGAYVVEQSWEIYNQSQDLLKLHLPAGATLQQAFLDGKPVVPVKQASNQVAIPLPTSQPSKRDTQVMIRMRGQADNRIPLCRVDNFAVEQTVLSVFVQDQKRVLSTSGMSEADADVLQKAIEKQTARQA